jgi:hypothetical protein
MNVGIRNKAASFNFWEFINRIFNTVQVHLPILLVYNRGISIAFTFWPQIKGIGTKNCSFTYIQTFEHREVYCFVHFQYFMNENKQAFLWPIILPRGGRERDRVVDRRMRGRCSYRGCQTSTDRQTPTEQE